MTPTKNALFTVHIIQGVMILKPRQNCDTNIHNHDAGRWKQGAPTECHHNRYSLMSCNYLTNMTIFTFNFTIRLEHITKLLLYNKFKKSHLLETNVWICHNNPLDSWWVISIWLRWTVLLILLPYTHAAGTAKTVLCKWTAQSIGFITMIGFDRARNMSRQTCYQQVKWYPDYLTTFMEAKLNVNTTEMLLLIYWKIKAMPTILLFSMTYAPQQIFPPCKNLHIEGTL